MYKMRRIKKPNAQPATPTTASILQLRVTLRHSDPAIWRQLELRADSTLEALHQVLQIAMGWDNAHLHQFRHKKVRYGPSEGKTPFSVDSMWSMLGLMGRNEKDEASVTIAELLIRAQQKLEYTYDFGDNWEHDIVLEARLEPEIAVQYPRCTAGERACPPEDCGGIPGFYSMLEVLKDRSHPEHRHTRNWLGKGFNEALFDRITVNKRLRRLG